MPPENPGTYKLDADDRLQIPKGALPPWLQKPTDDGELICVPIRWLRPASLRVGHELEAWCLWSDKATGKWVTDPREVLARADKDSVCFALRSLMYPAKYDSKGRLSCAGIFKIMARSAPTREFWVASEANSISIWTDVAFQWSYSELANQ